MWPPSLLTPLVPRLPVPYILFPPLLAKYILLVQPKVSGLRLSSPCNASPTAKKTQHCISGSCCSLLYHTSCCIIYPHCEPCRTFRHGIFIAFFPFSLSHHSPLALSHRGSSHTAPRLAAAALPLSFSFSSPSLSLSLSVRPYIF